MSEEDKIIFQIPPSEPVKTDIGRTIKYTLGQALDELGVWGVPMWRTNREWANAYMRLSFVDFYKGNDSVELIATDVQKLAQVVLALGVITNQVSHANTKATMRLLLSITIQGDIPKKEEKHEEQKEEPDVKPNDIDEKKITTALENKPS